MRFIRIVGDPNGGDEDESVNVRRVFKTIIYAQVASQRVALSLALEIGDSTNSVILSIFFCIRHSSSASIKNASASFIVSIGSLARIRKCGRLELPIPRRSSAYTRVPGMLDSPSKFLTISKST